MNISNIFLKIARTIFLGIIVIMLTALTPAQTRTNLSSYSDSPPANSNTSWIIGGRLGMAIGSGFGSSSVGLQVGPMAEVLFSGGMGVGTELNINTFSGTPIEWADYFKYYFEIPGSAVKPYADFGASLWFVTNGPFFGIRFGGGANFKVAKNLYIPADIQMGPVFYSTKQTEYTFNGFIPTPTTTSKSSTIFYIAITTGIRYMLP